MYYPCSENKGADQLRGDREADLRLCFRPCKLLVFSRTGSYLNRNVSILLMFMCTYSKSLLRYLYSSLLSYLHEECSFSGILKLRNQRNHFVTAPKAYMHVFTVHNETRPVLSFFVFLFSISGASCKS